MITPILIGAFEIKSIDAPINNAVKVSDLLML